MTKKIHSPSKYQALKEQGSLNPHPEKVIDKLFSEIDFFDPCDLVQVKYEMLRRVKMEGWSVMKAAEAFGFSRPSFYQAQNAFMQDGLSGLVSKKRGPRKAHKLTEEVMEFIGRMLSKDASLRMVELIEHIEKHFGFTIHPRSIERALLRREKKLR